MAIIAEAVLIISKAQTVFWFPCMKVISYTATAHKPLVWLNLFILYFLHVSKQCILSAKKEQCKTHSENQVGPCQS